MIYATMKEVFPTVVLVDATQSNDIIIAMTKEKSIYTGADHIEMVGSARALRRIEGAPEEDPGPGSGWEDARILTDDQALVEQAWT